MRKTDNFGEMIETSPKEGGGESSRDKIILVDINSSEIDGEARQTVFVYDITDGMRSEHSAMQA